MRTNEDKLVMVSVMGEISNPVLGPTPYKVTYDGKFAVLPGVGGIRYNLRVGDLAVGWAADHVEPGVSIKNLQKDGYQDSANLALNVLSCIGNEATVITGDAKGARGIVTGKHGGIEHVILDFPPDVLEKLSIGDRVQVKAYGLGLKILDLEGVMVMNLDPRLLKAMNVRIVDGALEVPVTHVIPASVMGSGLGASHVYSGDYDIQLFDEDVKRVHHLEDLRLGDLVAIQDADNSFGRIYKKGALSVGVVVHTDCVISGHGPGVTTVFTSSTGKISPRLQADANIADILNLRSK
jgi:hypothetical protein